MIIVERKSHGFREVILGRCGENNVLQIRINIQSLIDAYGDGNAVLVYKRSQDTIHWCEGRDNCVKGFKLVIKQNDKQAARRLPVCMERKGQ